MATVCDTMPAREYYQSRMLEEKHAFNDSVQLSWHIDSPQGSQQLPHPKCLLARGQISGPQWSGHQPQPRQHCCSMPVINQCWKPRHISPNEAPCWPCGLLCGLPPTLLLRLSLHALKGREGQLVAQ